MDKNDNVVFISYAWGDESEQIVNEIDRELQVRGLKLIRDKHDLGYKGSVREFMERIGLGAFVIVILSDKYLRSPNSMFELVEIADNKQFYDRVFPIVLADANIYEPVKRIEYIKYWEEKRTELAEAVKKVGQTNLQNIREDMDLYDRIRDVILGLTSILKDMNTLTPDMHRDSDFSELYVAIEKRLELGDQPTNVQANDNTVAVGRIEVGGSIGGTVTIGGDIRIGSSGVGYTTEQVSTLISQIQSKFKPSPLYGHRPYKGLDVFEEEDAELFFGRERLVNDLVSRVRESRTLFITGPSGSGKSSLVRAGLIPTLKTGLGSGWLYATMKPGREPVDELASVFSRLKDPSLGKYLRENAGQLTVLHECAESALSENTNQRLLLFIDQFEEVFTQLGKDKAQIFINLLAHAATIENGRVMVLFSMRSDFVSNCAAYPQLNAILNQQFVQIGAMQLEELVSAIAQPALRVGLKIEPDLIAQIINDMRGEPGALSLMQFVLKDLFDAEQAKGGLITLTFSDYLQRGGINRALESIANATLEELTNEEMVLARNVFSGLIEIGYGAPDTRRTALLDELIPANTRAEDVDTVIQKLADARLITTDEQAGKDIVTISHEKLIDAWPWLKGLVNENRDAIALQNKIAEDAKQWDEHARDESYLHTGARLANALEQIDANRLVLNGLSRTFIEASATQRGFSLGALAQNLINPLRRQPRKASLGETQQSSAITDQVGPTKEQQMEEQSDVLLEPSLSPSFIAETAAESDTTDNATEEAEAEKAIRLDAARLANLLSNNRSQAVFNDKPQGEDQLGIKDEVEALAETLLLRDVEPPVSVGVMGGWGSGKSFAMYLIHQYVQSTRAKKIDKGWADGVENDPKIPAFVGHVYQINFNAWTYAKSNLWASLMDTIFSCLNRQMQLERLLAHRNFSPGAEPPTKAQIKDSMLAGGDEFKKIYSDNIQIDQDKDLEPWRKNLEHWSQHLLKGTLLWNVMRGQQVETLEKLKDTEEQLNQLKARREQFEKARPLHEITTKSLKDETARKAYFQSIKSFMLAFLSDQLSATAKAELKQQDVKDEDVQKFLEEAKGLSGGIKTLVTAFRHSKIYLIWTIIFLALFFAVPFLWDQFVLEFVQLHIARLLSLFLTLLPTITVILPWIKKSLDASLEARKILEGAYATQQAKHAEKIANATDKPTPQKVSELQTDISNGSLAAYDALIGLLEAQAEEQRQKIGPSAKYSNLMEFVQSRLDAATYENQLGLMHQVRQDIDELTYSLVDGASPEFFPRGKPRVILYIDDLDRCPPSRVVEVLEAVQLLLNTKLFIVILGLDTRYVTRALEKEYKEILQHEGDPSGLDYIEKIIQIPYRVRSIEADNLRKYIEKQMDIEKVIKQMKSADTLPVQQETVQADLPAQSQPLTEIKPSLEQVVAEAIQAPSDHEKTEPKELTPGQSVEPGIQRPEALVELSIQASEQPLNPTVPASQRVETPKQPEPEPPVESKPKAKELPPIELPAAVIQFKQEDLEDLAACCQKIALTPRTIKRLINVFKLMKIFWFRADKNAGITERDRPRPVKQAAMSLLALSSAYPEVMREVFVHLETLYRQGQEQTELFTALNTIILPPGSTHDLASQLKKYKADIVALKAIRGAGQDKFGQLTLQDLKLSTFNIVRSFSFVGDPVYWTDGEDDSPRSKALQSEEKVSAPRKASKKKGN